MVPSKATRNTNGINDWTSEGCCDLLIAGKIAKLSGVYHTGIPLRIIHLPRKTKKIKMRHLFLIATVAFLSACGSHNHEQADGTADAATDTTTTNTGWFGEEFEITEAVAASDVAKLMNDSSSNEFIVEGTIQECCQKKGCWMKVDMGEGESMRVSFKDYGFFVPLDAGGSTMTMKGVAMYDTISVDFLKHLAEDANATQEEIDAITEPELALTFEATGVYIK